MVDFVPAASCHVLFQIQSTHGRALTAFDVLQCIKQAVAVEALFLQWDRETSTVHVGYDAASSVNALFNALDQRVVTLGQSVQVKLSVKRETKEGVATASREWEDDMLEEGEVDMRSVQEELFQRATPGHRPDTLVLRRLPCKWFGITAAEEGAGVPVAEAAALREEIENSLATIPNQIEAVYLPGGLLMDVYIQFGRTLAEVEKAYSCYQGKALRFQTSSLVLPLVVEVDRSGFFTEAQMRARLAVREREAQARQALEGKRIRHGKERKELAALLEALRPSDEEEEADGDDESGGRTSVRTELTKLGKTLADAESIDGKIVMEPGRMAAQGMLKEMGELQHHIRRGIAAVEAELARLREEVHEKQRLDEVREVRVAQARALKQSDHRWRMGLEALNLSKEVRRTKLCDSFIKTTEAALAEARDLVLREAHKIVNLEEYFQRLQLSLKDAEKKVGSTLRLLRVDGNAREVEAAFKELCESMKKAGEDALPKRRDSRLADEVVTGELDEILPPFLQFPSRAAAYRKALSAALLLIERRRSEDGQRDEQVCVDEFALTFEELDGHVRRLCPAWDLFVKLRMWETRLRRLEGGKEGKEPKPAVAHSLETAKVALQAAVAHLMDEVNEGYDETESEVEAVLGRLQQAVGDAEVAISKEKEKQRMRSEVIRRLAEERALGERNRDEEMRAKAREEAMGLLHLERLERRRRHLEASLRMEEARERLEELRAAGLLSPPVASACGSNDKEDVEDGVAMSVMGVDGSKAVVIAPTPIQDWERWSVSKVHAGPPLNLAWPDFLPNLVAADYWTRKGQQPAGGGGEAGYLRSEVVVIGSGAIVSGKRRHSDPLQSPGAGTSLTHKGSHTKSHKRGSKGGTGENPSKKTRRVML